MPELPEVETIVRGLSQGVLNKHITQVFIGTHNLRVPYPVELTSTLIGTSFTEVWRRAKYILLGLKESDHILVIHLGMSGKLQLRTESFGTFKKHEHFALALEKESTLVFTDPRRFGLVTLCNKTDWQHSPLFKHLGIEPLSREFNAEYLAPKFRKKRQPIKSTIMDAGIIVGVGNIYACESLFRARINPQTPAGDLNTEELTNLVYSIRKVLNESISQGGTTLRDYTQADGTVGNFQNSFNVYGRKGLRCCVCGNIIESIKQQGRSTFYCPYCQKLRPA